MGEPVVLQESNVNILYNGIALLLISSVRTNIVLRAALMRGNSAYVCHVRTRFRAAGKGLSACLRYPSGWRS
jgi:hypothetical protein